MRSVCVLSTMSRTAAVVLTTILASFGLAGTAQAQLVSQITNLNGECAGDVGNIGNCTAGEISLASVTNAQFVGNPTECAIGDQLTVSSVTVEYAMNTQQRYNLALWLGEQEGTDPREDGPTNNGGTCASASVPGPFNAPFNDANGDSCADVGTFTGNVARTFTNISFECQDNDNDGFADVQALITWQQNASVCPIAAGPLAGNFPVGSPSKCDYQILNSTLPVVVPPELTLQKFVVNDNGGTALDTAWTLQFSGPVNGSGIEGSPAVTDVTVQAGVYTLTESGPSGYTQTNLTCNGGSLNGNQLTLANNDDVTCTFTNNDQAATLTLQKTVINDNGGTALDTAFTLTATGPTTISGTEGQPAITNASVNAGVYTLTESGPAGYTNQGWQCTGGGSLNGNQLTLGLGVSATCTVTNNDQPATLTLTKTVINDNGGNAVDTDWTLSFAGPSNGSGAEGAAAVTNASVSAGVYTLTESSVPGYTNIGLSCSGTGSLNGNQLTLANGGNASCEFVNNDVAPALTLIKDVTNDNGGDAVPGSFTLILTGADGTHNGGLNYGSGDMPTVQSNVQYTLSEQALAGYTETGVACVDDDTAAPVAHPVTLNEGQSVTCTISNDDDVPQLTVVKEVINDDGGALTPADFTLHVTGNDGGGGNCGQDGAADYASGDMVTPVEANCAYTLSEDAVSGYSQTGIACVDDNTAAPVGHPVSLNEGQQVTCTITNNDAAAGLTLIKEVINDDGGSAVPADFTLILTGADGTHDAGLPYSSGDMPSITANITYTLSEQALAGYTEVGVECVDNTTTLVVAHPVSLTAGQSVTCTISNDDQPVTLTLEKDVTNDNGGTAVDTDWDLTATGPDTITGVEGDASITNAPVAAGDYTLTESGGPSGYTNLGWSCTGGTLNGNVVTLAVDDGSVTCTVTNDDQAATLTLQKVVINDNGGGAVAADWTLSAAGPTPISGPSGDPSVTSQPISAGVYTLSESGPAGYTAGSWNCSAGVVIGDQLTIGNGVTATCVIVNNDIAPGLTLIKAVINDDGGTAVPGSFTLVLTGADGVHNAGVQYSSGANPAVEAGVSYTLSEEPLAGYTQVGVSCVDNDTQGSVPHPVTLSVDQSVTCTLTNDDEEMIRFDPIAVPTMGAWASLLMIFGLLAFGWRYGLVRQRM